MNFSSVSTWLYSVIYSVNAEVVLKATNVDGVFDEDPKRNPQARLHETLTYQEVTSKDLSVMDMTAITLCQENNIPGKSRRQTFICTFIYIYICFLIVISLNVSLPCPSFMVQLLSLILTNLVTLRKLLKEKELALWLGPPGILPYQEHENICSLVTHWLLLVFFFSYTILQPRMPNMWGALLAHWWFWWTSRVLLSHKFVNITS